NQQKENRFDDTLEIVLKKSHRPVMTPGKKERCNQKDPGKNAKPPGKRDDSHRGGRNHSAHSQTCGAKQSGECGSSCGCIKRKFKYIGRAVQEIRSAREAAQKPCAGGSFK